MPHTYTKLLIHAVFSTKQRLPLINDAWRDRLYRYMAGILDAKQGHLIRAGGVSDHVHLLRRLNASTSAAEAMRLIKTNSAKWIHETYDQAKNFAWQTGYGAFSVSESMQQEVIDYVNAQQEHHRRMSFQEEYRAMPTRHGIDFDERHLWD